jgi:putative intracellular protease/amidase
MAAPPQLGSRDVTSVCTAAALLAGAGPLDGRRATTNKAVFGWIVEQGPRLPLQTFIQF